jgi:hypothetical protein
MPSATARLCERLLRDTLAIDAAYAGGPRVPTIRCYALDRTPLTYMPGVYKPWRDLMQPWSADRRSQSHMIMADVAYRHGLKERFADVPPRTNAFVDVTCYGDAKALAVVTDTWRMGAMTRYPIMEGVDHRPWGLHWQSMPVAFFRSQGDWGFLQWVAEEDGTLRALPALQRDDLTTHVLSDACAEAAVGRTFGRRCGNGFLVLRRLDAVAPAWPYVTDRFRLLDATCARPVASTDGEWRRLEWPYGAETLTLAFHPLEGSVQTSLQDWRWEQRYEWQSHRPQRLAGLWLLAMGQGAAALPVVAKDEDRWRVTCADGSALPLAPFAAAPWGQP